MKKFTALTAQVLFLSTLALGIAHAASPYDITLSDSFSVGRTELKPGDYKVEMQGDKAVFTTGKKTIQVPATMAKSDQTFATTVFVSQHAKLREIDLGGTQDKILFAVPGAN
jgi:hypothetical protein